MTPPSLTDEHHSKEKQMPTENIDREAMYGQLPSVSRLLAVLRKGKVDTDLTEQLAQVVGMVKIAHREGVKKGGELTIKVKVEPLTDDQVALSVEAQVKGPKLPPDSAILFVDETNHLATENPYAYSIPFDDLSAPEEREADELKADRETGEIL